MIYKTAHFKAKFQSFFIYAQYYADLVIQGHNLMIFFAFVFTRFRCQKQNRTLSYLI